MAKKRKPMSAAAREKISRALRGRHHKGHHKGHRESAATRAKISAALKARDHKRAQARAEARKRRAEARAAQRAIARAARRAARMSHKRGARSRYRVGSQFGPTYLQRQAQPVPYRRRRRPFPNARVKQARIQAVGSRHTLAALRRRRSRWG